MVLAMRFTSKSIKEIGKENRHMEEGIIRTSMNEQFSDLPINMTVDDVARFLGVSSSTAYKVVKQDSFPKLRIPGRRLVIVPKHLFLSWYTECSCPTNR
jgi:excisionase family DNA binding protein